MKNIVLVFGVIVALAYLLFWPVPVDPVAWSAPSSSVLKGAFQPNQRLQSLTYLDLKGETGPEDVALGADDQLYVSAHSGKVLKVDLFGKTVSTFSNPKGRVLGLETDANGVLFGADAYLGLLKFSATGSVTVLANRTYDGSPITYANDLDITAKGVIYFSDASQKFSAKAIGGTLQASLLDLVEHAGHGRVLKYDPSTQRTTVLLKDLNFANGIALAKDESYLLIAETGTYRILKHWLTGDKAGQTETLLDNLPGFPDNINDNPDGSFWVGLVSPRSLPLDMLSSYPLLRKVMMRLPQIIRPKPQRYGFAVRFSGDGKIIETLQDPAGDYALVTGGLDVGSSVIVTSLTEGRLGILGK